MKISFDPQTPAIYLHFIRGEKVNTVEEGADLIYLETGQLCACRVWLENTPKELGISDLAPALRHLTGSGWTLGSTPSEGRGVPWIFHQFVPASGRLGLMDWGVRLDLDTIQKTVTGIEILLLDAPIKLRP